MITVVPKPQSYKLRVRVCAILAVLALIAILVPSGASTQESSNAGLITDKQDYSPGEVVAIAGTGWQPGETVSLSLQRSPETQPDVSLSSVANIDGTFTNVQYTVMNQDIGVIFTLTATGESSGRTARAMFTDSINGRPGLTNTSSTNLGAGSPSGLAATIAGTGISNITNVTYIGGGGSSGTFTNGTQDTGLSDGIFLDTSFGPAGPSGDSQLSAILQTILTPTQIQNVGIQTTGATVLEFDFVPNGSQVKLEYVFASYDFRPFNDIFGFFINGQTAGYSSVFPTLDPSSNGPASFRKSSVITTQFSVQSGVVNHLKLVIADHSDTAIDTFAFIKAGGLAVVNSAPVAQANASSTGACPGNVTLDATGSSDPDGDILTAVWTEGSTVLGSGLVLDVSLPIGQHVLTVTVTDPSGATSTADVTVDVVDNTAPTITVPADIVTTLPSNSSATSMPVSFAVSATDNCGSATATASPASGSTFPVGTTTVTVTASDGAGNASTSTFKVTVRYRFTGFIWPVYNLPVVNKVRAGFPVPLIFKLSGNKGMNIFAPGSPTSGVIACNSTDSSVDTVETNTYPRIGLLYEPHFDLYVYVWKTEKSWKGQCRQVVVQLKDGSIYRANFKFK